MPEFANRNVLSLTRTVQTAKRHGDAARHCLRLGQLASAEMHLAALDLHLSDIEQAAAVEASFDLRPEPSRA